MVMNLPDATVPGARPVTMSRVSQDAQDADKRADRGARHDGAGAGTRVTLLGTGESIRPGTRGQTAGSGHAGPGHAGAGYGGPAANTQDGEAAGAPRFVSMKPPSEPGRKKRTRPLAAIDRPGMRPRVRPLSASEGRSSRPSLVPGALGHYAPPRASTERDPRPRLWPYLLLTVAAGVLGGGVAFWLLSGR